MAQAINKLDANAVRRKVKRGRYADGGGLYLQVDAEGNKSWIFRYQLDGRARHMGLGPVNTIGLQEARIDARKCRAILLHGIDPIDARRAAKAKRLVDNAKLMTFSQAADKYISAHSAAWRNVKHAQQWTNTLSTYANPLIGDLPIGEIDTNLILKILEPIWTRKPETAGRVRARIENILDWATARKLRSGENPARWRGHLDKLLPARSKVRKVKHHAALPYEQIGDFLTALREQGALSARGLEFMILTAARTGEIIGAMWDEINFDRQIWTISAERMKADREHRVPLSATATAVLRDVFSVRQNDFVFPGLRPGCPLSNMAFLQLLKRMGCHDITAHGFRSTFRDWAAERTNYPREVAEMALAHAVSDKVEAAYRRGDLFEKRRRLMDDWASYCRSTGSCEADVVPIRSAGGG